MLFISRECQYDQVSISRSISADNYMLDCFNHIMNKTFNCLPPFNIRSKRDFNELGNKLCDFDFSVEFKSGKNKTLNKLLIDIIWYCGNIYLTIVNKFYSIIKFLIRITHPII